MNTHVHPVCAIIGAGPGLGAALARRFAAENHPVLALSRDAEKQAQAGGILRWPADAADPENLAGALQGGAHAIGAPVGILIYNAYRATMVPDGPSTLDPEELVEDFRVNVAGALAATRAVLPTMRAAGRGTILFTGGGLALDPTGWLPAASLAIGKAGLRSLALTLHAELAPAGIHAGTVTIAGQIAPGTKFDPDIIAQAFWSLHTDPPGRFRNEIIFAGDTQA
jgi:NAD(P)-dependent dehydrogenase (short-subunit alcohol dehydrogenase family)